MSEPAERPGPRSSAPACSAPRSALALRRRRASRCCCSDVNPENVRTASGLGAGDRRRRRRRRRSWSWSPCRPTTSAEEVAAALRGAGAVVTDVGSVKSAAARRSRATWRRSDLLARYVGSHPMAGSERSGPLAASAALFDGRPWAVTPHDARPTRRRSTLVEALARLCGADAGAAHARTSTTGRWPAPRTCRTCSPCWSPAGSPTRRREHLALSGQGVRDVTRIAAGDPALWQQIVTAQRRRRVTRAAARGPRRRSTRCIAARRRAATGRRSAAILDRGVAGTAAIPGKHGGPAPADARRCSSRCPTTRASWPGCSPTPGRSASTSRTCASTTTRAARSAWSSCVAEDQRRAPAGVARGPGLDRPTGRLRRVAGGSNEQEQGSPAVGRGRRRDRRALGLGQVEHLARRRRPARPALPRHRRDVPRDDLVDAASTASTSHDAAAVAARADEPVIVSGTDPQRPDDHRRRRRRRRPDPRRRRSPPRSAPVSAVPEVRARLLELQRDDHRRRAASSSRAATSARWWPRTPPVKVYLTADPAARAARRTAEDGPAPTSPPPRPTCSAATGSTPAARPRRWRWPTAPSTSTPRRTPWTRSIDQVVALVRGRSEARA